MENIDFIFLDSGTGGLPYMQYLNGCCPHAKCVYIADTKNFPYGEKTAEQIIHAASNVVSLALSKWNPKAIVLACNTMSVTALPFLRNHFPDVPFIGTVPAIKLAAELSHNGRIGLLATNKTVTDPYTKELIEKYASDCLVFSRGDSDLIDFIEHKLFKANEYEKLNAIKPAVEFFEKNKVDTIILGCTHFVHIVDDIKKLVKNNVQIIDSRGGVIRQALKVAFNTFSTDEYKSSVTEPSFDKYFFVTSLKTIEEKDLYMSLCERFSLTFGGELFHQN